MSSLKRDDNRIPSIGGVDSSTSLVVAATIDHATGGLDVNLVGGSSSGTQYVDAALAATHPTGTGIIFNNAGTYNFVSTAQPLPITIISGNPTTIAATQSGTWTVGLSAAQTLATVTSVGAVTGITNALPAG